MPSLLKVMRYLLTCIVICAFPGLAAAAPSNTLLINKAKQSATKELKDPDSAKFRNIAVVRESICGEVNAKNSYGGYVGYKRFVSVGGVVALHDDGTQGFNDFFTTSCSKNPPKPKAPPQYYEESWKDIEKDLAAPKGDEAGR